MAGEEAAGGVGLGGISGAVGALFGIAGTLSQAAASKAAIQRANEEAALAVAQARDNISKIPELEKELPVIAMNQIRKDAARSRKQLLDAVRGSGARTVLGAVPNIGEQAFKEREVERGITEKQLKERDDAIVKAEQARQDLELQMLTATGTAARQRAAAAAKQQASAIAGAGTSAAALGGEILGMSDLYGGEKRRFNRAVDTYISDTNAPDAFDREGFVDYLNTRSESIEDLTDMLGDPDNTLMADYFESLGDVIADEQI
jgi:hypothetical protein|tara:strand:+ start:451 stop:1233 length:783 start_codon:yes stop_codon:yes gene_type:complete